MEYYHFQSQYAILVTDRETGDENMIYKCEQENCGFLFERAGEVERCPDCGSKHIRPADEKEQREYMERRNK